MSTPAEHYAKAEELLAAVARGVDNRQKPAPELDRMLAQAQVHATLACAWPVDDDLPSSPPTRDGQLYKDGLRWVAVGSAEFEAECQKRNASIAADQEPSP